MASTAKRTSPAAVSAILKRGGYSPIPSGKRRDTEDGVYVTASPIANADAMVVLQIQDATSADLSLHESIVTKALTDARLSTEAIVRHRDGRRIEIYVARRIPVSAKLASGHTAVQIDGQDYMWLVRRDERHVFAIELNEGADIADVDLDDVSDPKWRYAGIVSDSVSHWSTDVTSEDYELIITQASTEGDAIARMLSQLDTQRPAREERRLLAKLTLQWDLLAEKVDDDREQSTCFWSGADDADLTMVEEGLWAKDADKRERTSRWYEVAFSSYQSLMDDGMYREYAKEA